MVGKRSGRLARNAVLLGALACAATAFADTPKAVLDVAIGRESGHALIGLGFASVRFAFDSGQSCSNSNACAGSIL